MEKKVYDGEWVDPIIKDIEEGRISIPMQPDPELMG
jgi:hypothetical protein